MIRGRGIVMLNMKERLRARVKGAAGMVRGL